MSAELMVYALVAAGLIFWLRSILGTNSDNDSASATKMELSDEGKIIKLGGDGVDNLEVKAVSLIEALVEEPKGNMLIGGQAAQQGLIEIAKVDKEFDIYVFLQAAQDAFVFVVESFAEGDRDTLKDLLGKQVYEAFDGAITQREKSGETVVTEISSIKKSEVINAWLDGKSAMVTIRFWADETSVTKDKDDKIVSGHPDKTTLMRDVWTFSRNLKSRDPRWLVVETKEDGEGDNDSIPNTH